MQGLAKTDQIFWWNPDEHNTHSRESGTEEVRGQSQGRTLEGTLGLGAGSWADTGIP